MVIDRHRQNKPFKVVDCKNVATILDQRRLELERLVGAVRRPVDGQVEDAVAGLLTSDLGNVFAAGQKTSNAGVTFPDEQNCKF